MSIKIDLKIFLFALIFFFTHQIQIYAILMLFALIHELGHLIAGLILKFKPSAILINPFGLQAEFEIECKDYNKKILKGNKLALKKVIIALAGPLTNIIIILLIALFYPNNLQTSKNLLIYSNILIGIFNLIPIYPLDGGRAISELLHITVGLKTSYEYTNLISNTSIIMLTAISSIAILYLKNISILIILAYLWYLVIRENKRYNIKMKLYKIVEEKTWKFEEQELGERVDKDSVAIKEDINVLL